MTLLLRRSMKYYILFIPTAILHTLYTNLYFGSTGLYIKDSLVCPFLELGSFSKVKRRFLEGARRTVDGVPKSESKNLLAQIRNAHTKDFSPKISHQIS